MSKMICVMGESGSGKTTSMRTLDPATTYYIDCDRKGLAWKGWREQYSTEKKNFTSTRDLVKVNKLITNVSDKAPHMKTIVIDTLNTCMVGKEIKEMDNKDGYSKWIDLAQFVWTICETGATLLKSGSKWVDICPECSAYKRQKERERTIGGEAG